MDAVKIGDIEPLQHSKRESHYPHREMKRKLQNGPFLSFLPPLSLSLSLPFASFDHNLFFSSNERDKTSYRSSTLIAYIHSRRQISLENLHDITRGWQTRYRWIQSEWHCSKPSRSIRIRNVWASLSDRWWRVWHGCGIDIVSSVREGEDRCCAVQLLEPDSVFAREHPKTVNALVWYELLRRLKCYQNERSLNV